MKQHPKRGRGVLSDEGKIKGAEKLSLIKSEEISGEFEGFAGSKINHRFWCSRYEKDER